MLAFPFLLLGSVPLDANEYIRVVISSPQSDVRTSYSLNASDRVSSTAEAMIFRGCGTRIRLLSLSLSGTLLESPASAHASWSRSEDFAPTGFL
ncbi:hypothetical protein BDW66DRAFT_137704 [Aspergillus desertorum]